ncbi:cytidine deaminase [Aliiroseovarius sediminis]|uniref:cytidine deaminase n=1 Tax=uncultured Aliiroseovarius sp. TaxID=1658783 RepID=UPI00210212D9|nr:cytidine deaminase [Aliiroseovarius sediminis]
MRYKNHDGSGGQMSLLDVAKAARENAYVPYSTFKVGAALRCASGAVYAGCNVENVAYPEGTCAEAGAIAAMALGGDRKVVEVVVIADAPLPVTPCGGCRQKLAEFADADATVTMMTMGGESLTMTVAELLPGAFGPEHMVIT